MYNYIASPSPLPPLLCLFVIFCFSAIFFFFTFLTAQDQSQLYSTVLATTYVWGRREWVHCLWRKQERKEKKSYLGQTTIILNQELWFRLFYSIRFLFFFLFISLPCITSSFLQL